MISTVCAWYFTLRYGCFQSLKISSLCISAGITLPVAYVSLFCLLFGNLGQETVVKTFPSPSGVYCARVISHDQGALGGSTVVEVYDTTRSFDLILFRVEKNPKEVYHGQWHESQAITILWQDDSTLLINTRPYKIE